MKQRTLFIIKPDAVRRGLSQMIIKDVEGSGLAIAQKKEMSLSQETLKKLYEEHEAKPFYARLISFMSSGPVVCVVVDGENAVERLRTLMGNTMPSKASSDSIRGKYKGPSDIGPSGAVENVVHGSDSPKRAQFEIELIFGKEVGK